MLSNCLFTKFRRAFICISCRRGGFLCLQPVKLFFSLSSVMLTWKNLINGNVMLTTNLGWNWSHTIFLTFLDESFCFFPRLSGLSTVWNSLYFFIMVRKVETGSKNCVNMTLYLFQFLWTSTLRILRSALSSSPHAMLTPMLLEDECQLLQMRKLS